MSLLDELKKIDKEVKLTSTHLPPLEDQETYVQTQIDEMQKIIHRNRVDILINNQMKANTAQEKLARDNKVSEHQMSIVQLRDAIDTLTALRKAL